MSSSYANHSFQDTLHSFLCADGLPFDAVLSEDYLQNLAQQHHLDFAPDDNDIYTPAITLWLWLSQCLSAAKSCLAAVARLLVLRVASGLPPCSAATGAYCKARAKLSEPFLHDLTLHVGTETERQVPDHWRWRNRRVLLADGTECSAPDTPALQEVYPQSSRQKPGLGYPRIRLVVLLALASACLVGCATGPHKGKGTGETSLFRELLGHLLPGDVLVADRYYCAYWLIAQVQQRGADLTSRLHSRRSADFRKGQRLGRGDHVVTWPRPSRAACLR
jgi:putative transposase